MMSVLGVAVAIFGAAYFLPTIIACCRDTKGKGWIFILNLLFGFTGLGYAMAMMQAFGPTLPTSRQTGGIWSTGWPLWLRPHSAC
jgi:hypothetical protein